MGRKVSTKVSWAWGEQRRLAQFVGITPSFLSEILHRKKRPSGDVAIKLAGACKQLGIPLSLMDWLQSDASPSPLFRA